jgi:hypothetical protein
MEHLADLDVTIEQFVARGLNIGDGGPGLSRALPQ